MDVPPLIRRAASALQWLLGIVLLILHPASASAETDLPERPSDYLMDRGGVFPPEKAREIAAALNGCARDYDIHIYIMTVPTLGVLPSRAREKLDTMQETAKSKWLEGKAGALLIFDYESGAASIAESDEARRIFSPVSINLIRQDPRLQYTRRIKSSDQVERAANVLIEGFSDLRRQTNEEARRRKATQKLFGGIAGGGLLLLIATAFAKRRFPTLRAQAPRETADGESN